MHQILWMLCGLLLLPSLALAQPGSATETAVIEVVDSGADVDFLMALVDATSVVLSDYNVQFEMGGMDDADLRLSYARNQYGQLALIEPLRPTELDISPVLYARYDRPVHLSFFNDFYTGDVPTPTQEQAARWMAGLTLYALGRCDAAYDVLDGADVYDPDTALSLGFYRGTCAILNDNFEAAARAYSHPAHIARAGVLYANAATINLGWVLVQSPQSEAWDLPTGINTWPFMLEECGEALWPDCSMREWVDQITRIARLHALNFQYDLAEATVDRAIAIVEEWVALNMDSLLPIFTNTDLAALYTLRGQMVILLYEWDRVLENYDTALTLDADYAPAYFYRGVLYYSVLARERALADFETYLEMASDGDNAADAARYVESIRLELDALSG